MKASGAVDGKLYRLQAKANRPSGSDAECHGWNYTREGVLFLIFDEFGRRKMLLVGPDEEIEEK